MLTPRFDDVFIFDFFSDSPADEKTWRVVSGCLGEPEHRPSGEEEAAELAAPRPEPFDMRKHSLLCDELKMLYTAQGLESLIT